MGKWLECDVCPSKWVVDEVQTARCSKCSRYHVTPYLYNFKHYNYCPHCGEPMESNR